jgi:ribosomal protein L11 methyltransferase
MGQGATQKSTVLILLTLVLRQGCCSFAPVRCGRAWIAPVSCVDLAPAAAVEIRLDVDQFTFLATTSDTIHVTTRALVEWLSELPQGPGVLLDYGCGSGVLGIAALRLAVAETAVLTDISEGAVACAQRNAALNAVQQACECVANLPAVLPARATADICVANMLAGPLCTVALEIAGRMRPGARLAFGVRSCAT